MPAVKEFELSRSPGWNKIAFHISHLIHGAHLRIAIEVPEWITKLCDAGKALMLHKTREHNRTTQITELVCVLRCAPEDLPEEDRSCVVGNSVLVCFFAMTAKWDRDCADPLTPELRRLVEDLVQPEEFILWWQNRATIIDKRPTLEEAVAIVDLFVARQNAAFVEQHGRLPDFRKPADYQSLDWAGMVQVCRTIGCGSDTGHRMLIDYAKREGFFAAFGELADDVCRAFLGDMTYNVPGREITARLDALRRVKAAVAAEKISFASLRSCAAALIELLRSGGQIDFAFATGTREMPTPRGITPGYWLDIFFRQPALDWWGTEGANLQDDLDATSATWFETFEDWLARDREESKHSPYR